MKTLLVVAALLLASPLAAQETAVPVDQEPHHEVVLKNDYVEVMRVRLPPGQRQALHTHSHDGVAIRLSESTVSVDVPGQDSNGPLATHPGDVSVQAYAEHPFTHRVNNVGASLFEVVDIELLKRPDGPASEPIAAPAAENASVRTYRWSLAPGGSTPEHTHRRPYLIVAATPMQLVMRAPDGAAREHPVVAGDFHWIESTVTHVLTNNGQQAGVLVEVELE